jgi:hypothetical protein
MQVILTYIYHINYNLFNHYFFNMVLYIWYGFESVLIYSAAVTISSLWRYEVIIKKKSFVTCVYIQVNIIFQIIST